MTYHEKESRREARAFGKRVTVCLEHIRHWHKEASTWRELASRVVKPEDASAHRFAIIRAEQCEDAMERKCIDVLKYSRLAFRSARESQST